MGCSGKGRERVKVVWRGASGKIVGRGERSSQMAASRGWSVHLPGHALCVTGPACPGLSLNPSSWAGISVLCAGMWGESQ